MANKKRGLAKAIIVVAGTLALLGIVAGTITEHDIDVFKHSLNLWTVISLVIIINLVSFLCAIIMFTAWRWIKSDLKEPKDDLGD